MSFVQFSQGVLRVNTDSRNEQKFEQLFLQTLRKECKKGVLGEFSMK